MYSSHLRRVAPILTLALLITSACTPRAHHTMHASESRTLSPPPTRVSMVRDTLFGTVVEDPYRWLEDGSSPEVEKWTNEQNAYTQAWLERAGGRARIRSRLDQLLKIGYIGQPAVAGDVIFYEKREGEENQPILYRRVNDGPAQVVLDPNRLSSDGTVALDWFYPSPDGRLLAYGLSRNGTERSTLHVRNVDTGAMLPDSIPDTRACSLAWLHDESGFYYTRNPEPGTVPKGDEPYYRHVYFHRLGTDPAADSLIYGKGVRKEDWPWVDLSVDDRWLTIYDLVSSTHAKVYTIDRRTGTRRTLNDTTEATFGGCVVGDTLVAMTNLDAPRFRIVATTLTDTGAVRWRTIIPEGRSTITSFALVRRQIVLHTMVDASSRLTLYSMRGDSLGAIPLPALGTVGDLAFDPAGSTVCFAYSSFCIPPIMMRYRADDGSTKVIESVASDLDTSRYVVEQVWYPSRDGTPVSMFVVHRKGFVLNGKNPTLLTGYGGFDISMTPVFQRNTFLWLENGGVYAVANLRGGGEYGESWHRAGMLGKKQNTFDDFIAASEWLIRKGYTSPEHLAIQGASNGGLLVGAVITQRPDLYRAALCEVPLLDMIRYPKFLIARLWIPEYGDPTKPDAFRWLYAYSPYHHVRKGVKYPAVMLTAGASDTRVSPMHARKMAARLQADTASGLPILLRVEMKAGHGEGKPRSKILDELADEWTFVFHELGVPPPK